MHLTALSAGYAIPSTDFDATLHSVFHSAVNLLPLNGDLLLTLVAVTEADLPQGIRLSTPAGFSFENLHVGEKVTYRNGLLAFERVRRTRLLGEIPLNGVNPHPENSHLKWCDAPSPLTIDLRTAKRWQCDLSALQADLTNPGIVAAWKFAWQMLNEHQKRLEADIVAENLFRSDEKTPSLISRRAGEAIRALVAATQRCDPETTSIVSQLIGLGAGLTPSGDDLLVGYLGGLYCAVRGVEERQQFVSGLGETVIQLSNGTNDISRTYLCHAARGQVSRRLETLARAICRAENPEQLLAAAESAMQTGHSSGTDAVAGLLVGLATWDIFGNLSVW